MCHFQLLLHKFGNWDQPPACGRQGLLQFARPLGASVADILGLLLQSHLHPSPVSSVAWPSGLAFFWLPVRFGQWGHWQGSEGGKIGTLGSPLLPSPVLSDSRTLILCPGSHYLPLVPLGLGWHWNSLLLAPSPTLFFVMSLHPEQSFINSPFIKLSFNHPNLNVPSVPRQDPDWASAYWPCSLLWVSLGSSATLGRTGVGMLVFIVASPINHVNDHFFPYSWSCTFSDTPMTCLPASQGHHALSHMCCLLENLTFSASSVPFPHQKLPPTTTSFFLRTQTLSLSAEWPGAVLIKKNCFYE